MPDITFPKISYRVGPIYPENADDTSPGFDRYGAMLEGVFRQKVTLSPDTRFVERVLAHEPALLSLSDDELTKLVVDHKGQLKARRLIGAEDKTFAIVREVSRRVAGIRHHDVQIMGGHAIVNGRIAEMATGEGKTYTAILAAAAAAMNGEQVHVITVNDYLAARDHETTLPIYSALGLTSKAIVHSCSREERRNAYHADITYCSNKEVAFDYLRDRMVLREQDEYSDTHLKLERLRKEGDRASRVVLRGLPFAIIDEADSVLIDEARTPLILSASADNVGVASMTADGIAIAKGLTEDEHYTLDIRGRNVELTDDGRHHLDQIGEEKGGDWRKRILREEVVTSALSALHLFTKGEHYVVREGKVQIVDENTGRIMEDRQWNAGLHQLVEEKEGVEISPQNTSLAQITYQRLFRRYHRLSGMTGTAREVTGELWSVYGLSVVTIPTHKPCVRKVGRPRIFPDRDQKIGYVVYRAKKLSEKGAPVLIGTRTISTSTDVSDALTKAGLAHQVLNAEQDENEATLIAEAGKPGAITVATNMAGRGTDIKLQSAAVEAGGLHVILTELHQARRIDRQLIGRSARQGDPGQADILYALDDEIILPLKRSMMGRMVLALSRLKDERAISFVFRYAQQRYENSHAKIRRALLRQDQSMGDLMAFTGKPE